MKNDFFDIEAIKSGIDTSLINEVLYYDETASTNLTAKELEDKYAENGALILCGSQNAGRGRFSRSWHTDPDSSVALSLLLKRKLPVEKIQAYNLCAAVSLAETIRAYTDDAFIKWPNDVVNNDGKKYSGILIETVNTDIPCGKIIIGIGANINSRIFPEDIKATATSLYIETKKYVNRNEFIISLVNSYDRLLTEYQHDAEKVLGIYCKYSLTLNKNVIIYGVNDTRSGLAAGFDDCGRLMLKTESGIELIDSGDVSFRRENERNN